MGRKSTGLFYSLLQSLLPNAIVMRIPARIPGMRAGIGGSLFLNHEQQLSGGNMLSLLAI